MKLILAIVALLGTLRAQVYGIPYSEYILAPTSRIIRPTNVYQLNGTVSNAHALVGKQHGTARFHGVSAVTYDFGKNVAGVVSLVARSSSSRDAIIWLTYSESSLWINGNGSDATADAGLDAPLPLHVGKGPGTYSVGSRHQRGAFRYLSLISNTSASIDLTELSVWFTAAPKQNLQDYKGYFHTNDELLNRIWYAGAYTTQLCTIEPNHGNALVLEGMVTDADHISLPQTDIWYNNYTISNGSSVLTDGGKRDRLLYSGDMAISLPSIAYSTHDMDSGKNSLNSLYLLQLPNGRFPYTGLPFSADNATSFTYHLHTLIGTYNYYHYSGHEAWLRNHWQQYKLGLSWSLSYVDDSGLMNVTSSSDWLRQGMGGHNLEANSILVLALNQAMSLADDLGDTSVVSEYSRYTTSIKAAINKLLWDPSANLFKDNETTTLYPQDGNSFAVIANVPETAHQTSAIASALKARWGKYGAPAPEVGSSPATISPFIGGFELEAHFLAGDASSALDLVRLQWGFMINDPRMTNSSLIEGYTANGSLHYAPYPNDPRVSHAHGWSTGPTSVMSRYVAGIQLTSAAGKTWKLAPMLGGLTSIEGGISTDLGLFSVDIKSSHGEITEFGFKVPQDTIGDIILPKDTEGTLKGETVEDIIKLRSGMARNIKGGKWILHLSS